MRPVALFVSGINADHMPAGLHEDRARLHGLPPPSIEAVRKAAIRNLHLVRPQLAWLADMLQDGRPYLLGGTPCIADFAAYHVVWFFKGRHIDCRHELAPYPRLLAWRDRMAAIGHGQRTDIDPEEALAVARAAEPATPRPSQPQDGDPRARRARPRAPGGQRPGLGRGRGQFHRRPRDRAGARDPDGRPGRRALPAAGLRLAASV